MADRKRASMPSVNGTEERLDLLLDLGVELLAALQGRQEPSPPAEKSSEPKEIKLREPEPERRGPGRPRKG